MSARRESQLSPFRREGLIRRTAPFAVAMILALAALELPALERDWDLIRLAGGLNLVIFALVAVLPWERLPRSAEVIPPLVYLVVVSLLRDGAGGTSSEYETLMILPIFWLALYGTRAQLAIGVAGIAVLLGTPILTIGEPNYPDEDWRLVLLGTTAAGIVGLAVQDLVDGIRQRAEALQTVSEAVGRRTHEVETRWAICDAARQAAKATWVGLLEPDANARRLVVTAATAPEVEGTEAWLTDADSPAVRAYERGRPQFLDDVEDPELFQGRDGGATAVASAHFHPFRGRDAPLAVLALAWEERVKRLPETLPAVLEALAAEAAGVIERTTLILRIESAVKVDEGSGLPNLRAFQEELPREISRARRSRRPLSVAILDIGDLERDSAGELGGPERRLLQNLGDRWGRLVAPGDFLAALEGGRFGVILPERAEPDARAITDRMREASPPGRVCVAGVATWDGLELPAALVARAEEDLHVHRATGPVTRD